MVVADLGSRCMACGSLDCPGLAAIDFCPHWQEAEARHARGEFITLDGEIRAVPQDREG